MADIHISFSLAMIVAGILAEIVSVLWYNNRSPWGHRTGERYLLAAILFDAGLVVAVKFIMENYYSVGRWEDAAALSLWLALLYTCLEGPHHVHDHRSFTWFFFHAVHKFLVLFTVSFALFYFRYLG